MEARAGKARESYSAVRDREQLMIHTDPFEDFVRSYKEGRRGFFPDDMGSKLKRRAHVFRMPTGALR